MRVRRVTPHRLFLAVVAALASARVESLADLLRAFNHEHGDAVAYKAFYSRCWRRRGSGSSSAIVRLLSTSFDGGMQT